MKLVDLEDGFWRDASCRLVYSIGSFPSARFREGCDASIQAFGLRQENGLVVGFDEKFWDFRRSDQVVGLEWDIWTGFSVVAKSPESEPLVRQIAAWLKGSPWSDLSE